MNVIICTSKPKSPSSLLQYDDKKFQLLKTWQSNGKTLTPQNRGEKFKFSDIQHWLPKLPKFYMAYIIILS